MFDQNMINQMWANAGVGSARPMPGGKPVNPKRGSRNQNTASSLISEAGGTGGALAGAAGGAALGSIVPGIGTVIGGLIGAGIGGFTGGTGGRLIENQVRDGEFRLGDAVEEGAIAGVLGAGPGSLLKLGRGGASALAGKEGLESALVKASKEPLQTSVRGKLASKGDQMLANQYGTIGKPIARATGGAKTVGQIADIGIVKPQDAERIAGAVTGSDGIINRAVVRAVGGAKPVDLSNMNKVVADALTKNGLVDANAKSVGNIINAQLSLVDPKDPSSVLKVMKNLEGVRAGFLGTDGRYHIATTADKQMATAVKQVRDELQEGLFNVAGANKNLKTVLTPEFRQELLSLNPKNGKWQNFVDEKVMKAPSVGDLRSTMAPFVNIRKIIDEGELNSMTAGGRLGNGIAGAGGTLPGMMANLAGKVVKDPANRAGGQALRAAGDIGTSPLTSPGAKGITGRIGAVSGFGALGETYGGAKVGASAFGAGNREGSAMNLGMGEMSLEEAMLSGQGLPPSGGMMGEGGAIDPMMAQESGNPYSKENLLADMQRDPKNADKYMEQYMQMEEIFGPKSDKPMSAEAAKVSSNANIGLQALGDFEGAVTADPSVLTKRVIPGRGMLGGALGAALGTRGADAASAQIIDVIARLRTGAAITNDEAKRFEAFIPQAGDSPQVARQKLGYLRNQFSAISQNTGRSGSSLEEALMQQQGAY